MNLRCPRCNPRVCPDKAVLCLRCVAEEYAALLDDDALGRLIVRMGSESYEMEMLRADDRPVEPPRVVHNPTRLPAPVRPTYWSGR